ncbi:hypothetical protein HI914_01292 [Erysiphe necator]|nr:hypothetical protein HI914_01292 [Erysiphe necator]
MEAISLIRRVRIPVFNELVRRASDSSSGSKCGPNPCEKPISSSTFTLPIILGVAVPLIGAAILFLILQHRYARKMREEDANDPHASLDFGLGEVHQVGRSKRAEAMSREKEKASLSSRQVSMDMSINNSYLPSYEKRRSSRESLDSISMPLRKQDPYGPLSQTNNNDTGYIRSHPIYTSGTNDFSNSQPCFYDNLVISSDNSSTFEARNYRPVAFPPRVNSLLPFQSWDASQTIPAPNSRLVEPPQAYIPTKPVAPYANMSTY